MKNNNLYNDKELNDDADLNWYDYGFRSYDPQIGRFPQLDPLTDGYPELTPYQYASNEPIANIDIDGLEKGSAIAFAWGGEIAKSTVNFAPIATKVVETVGAKIGGQIIKSALKPLFIRLLPTIIRSGGLTAILTLLPLQAGPRTNDELGRTRQFSAQPDPSVGTLPDPYPTGKPADFPGHSNRKANPNLHIVYALYGKIYAGPQAGKKVLLKFGISDYRRYKEKRPKSQGSMVVNSALRKDNHPLKDNISDVTYELEFFENRTQAVSEEIRLVRDYIRRNKQMPPIQKLPAPGIGFFDLGSEW